MADEGETLPGHTQAPRVAPGRSCIACRKRKIRCDRHHPCTYCTKIRVQCVYPTPEQRESRKLPDDDLLSRLERVESALVRLETTAANDGTLVAQRPSHETLVGVPEDVQSTPSGRLVVEEGGTRYVNGSFWAALEQEDEELGTPSTTEMGTQMVGAGAEAPPGTSARVLALAGTMAEEVAPVPISAPNDSDDYQKFIFGMSIAPEPSGLHYLHPPETRIFTLWQIYLENVDPLLKIVHVPTTQGQILRACSHLGTIPPPVEAVMFSMYYSAITSLQDSTRMFPNEDRGELLERYRTGLERALAKAKFMTRPEVPTLQALTLYLICARQSMDKSYVWTMVGLLYRLATKLGLHRDPASLGLPPFMIEMRRRLWWQICILDVRTAEDNDTDPLICEHNFDTNYPTNVNDGDLDVNMVEPLNSSKRRTDMLFCLTRFEISYTARKLVFSPKFAADNGYPTLTLIERTQLIDDTFKDLEEKYLRFCDQQIPICFLAVTASRLVLAKMKLTIHHPTRNESSKLSQEQLDGLVNSSIDIITYAHELRTNDKYSRWIWLFQQYVEWDAVAFLLHSLSVSALPAFVSKAWEAVDTFLGDWKDHAATGNGERRWRRLLDLQAKAKAKQGNAAPSVNIGTTSPDAVLTDANSSTLPAVNVGGRAATQIKAQPFLAVADQLSNTFFPSHDVSAIPNMVNQPDFSGMDFENDPYSMNGALNEWEMQVDENGCYSWIYDRYS